MRGEELSQHGAALVFEDSPAYLGPVRQPPIPDDIPQRADGARLGLPGTEDHPGNPRRDQRARAHRARLECHSEDAPFQTPTITVHPRCRS